MFKCVVNDDTDTFRVSGYTCTIKSNIPFLTQQGDVAGGPMCFLYKDYIKFLLFKRIEKVKSFTFLSKTPSINRLNSQSIRVDSYASEKGGQVEGLARNKQSFP